MYHIATPGRKDYVAFVAFVARIPHPPPLRRLMKSSNIGQSRQFAEGLEVGWLVVGWLVWLGVEELEVVELGVVRDSSKPSNQSAET